MGLVHKLEYNDGSAQTLSLVNTSGIMVTEVVNRLADAIGENSDPPDVIETLHVQIVATSADNLASTIQSLLDYQVRAAKYDFSPHCYIPVWYHQQTLNETGERRALVRKIEFQLAQSIYDPGAETNIDGTITLTRHPYWERVSARSLPTATPSAAAAIAYDYTAAGAAVSAHDIVGDAAARIGLFRMDPGTTGGDIDKLWMGIRSNTVHPTITNFVAVWECENGSNESVAGDFADANASGGYVVRGTPTADDTWEKYFTLELQDISANESAHFGHFLFLLRACLSAANDTYQVQLRFGYTNMSDDEFERGEIVEVSGATPYDFYEMGYASIPLHDWQTWVEPGMPDSSASEWAIQVWAKRLTAATSDLIYFDCFCPIPVDEGFLFATDLDCAETTSDRIYLSESPKGEMNLATTDSAQDLNHLAPPSSENFRLPIGDGRIIVVFQRAAGSTLTDTIEFQGASDGGDYYERWSLLRGGE